MRFLRVLLAAIAALAFGFMGTARAEWRKAESPHFVVYADLPVLELRKAIESLEEFDAVLRSMANVDEKRESQKLVAYLVFKNQIQDVYPGVGEGILGFYKSSSESTALVASKEEVEENYVPTGSRIPVKITYFAAKSTLQHEYAHHFMLQYFPGAYPKWYVEGFAEYYSSVSIKDGDVNLGAFELGRVTSLRDGHWTPMRQIMGDLKGKYRGDFVNDLYAQSWLAVSYFNSTPERQVALTKYLQAVSNGEKNLDKALRDSTGMSFEELDKALQKYMNSKIVTRQFSGWKYKAPEVEMVPLTAAQAKGLLLDARVKLQVITQDTQKQKTLEDVRKARAAYPNDSFLDALAARAEIYFGDPIKGRELAQAIAAALPENADAHYLIGLSYMEEGRKDEKLRTEKFKEARPHLARAFKRDPNHIGALYQTGLSLMATNAMTENTANVLMLAHQLAPQVGEISISTARAMINLGKREEAIALLEPVANNPHAGKLSEQAQAMIDGLQGIAPFESEIAAAAPG